MNLSGLDMIMKLHSWLRLPAMTAVERNAFKTLLLKLSQRGQLNVFEYGSGYSTLYFAKFLSKKGIQFSWDSVDNNLDWYHRVHQLIDQSGLAKHVSLHVFPFRPCFEKPHWRWEAAPRCGEFAPTQKEEQDYIELPSKLGKKYDLIFVDARFRRRCLEVALRCLRPEGVVFLHDAQKDHYRVNLAQYPHGRLLDSGKYFPGQRRKFNFWVGSLCAPTIAPFVEQLGY